MFSILKKYAQEKQINNFLNFVKENGFSCLNASHPITGDTLLILAVRNSNIVLVRWLYENCNQLLERTNFEGKSAVHEAAQCGDLLCIKYLLRQGASVDSIKRGDW